MYHRFYGLSESPFSLTPDPKYLFLSDAHREALASVIYGVEERKGFVLILGEVGTGKTTLVRHVLGRLDDGVRVVYIFNTILDPEELLQLVLRDLEVPAPPRRRIEMLEALNDYLIRAAEAGHCVVLIIDEAQSLPPEVLEELRMLSNLETARSKLLQVVLIGQPELAGKLARPGLRQLRQRIGLIAELRPLTYRETARYIDHRLAVAGYASDALFTRLAVWKIYRASRGIPRLVNVVCDKALVLGYAADARRIGWSIVSQVVRDWRVFRIAPVPRARSLSRREEAGVRAGGGRGVRLASVLAGLIALPALVFLASGHRPTPAGSPPREARESTPSPAAAAPARVPERAAASAAPPRPIAPAAVEREVTVKTGDTLGGVVASEYGRRDPGLLDLIRLANPGFEDLDRIRVGQRLVLPRPPVTFRREGGGGYVLHLATLESADSPELERLRRSVADRGRQLSVTPVPLASGWTVYRATVGSFADPREARAFYQSLGIQQARSGP